MDNESHSEQDVRVLENEKRYCILDGEVERALKDMKNHKQVELMGYQ